jgi:outer membrane protein insertion porin family
LNTDRGITASLTGRLGLVLPWGKSGKDHEVRTSIADRFFMGGIGCMRQFENNGVGPSDMRRDATKESNITKKEDSVIDGVDAVSKRDALGGDFVWSVTAAVQMDIPGEKFEAIREAGIHFHAFTSAGTLLPLDALSTSRNVASAIRTATRACVGVGVVWPLPVGQIEINYGKALRVGENDRVKNGFQVGVAAHISL